VRGKGVPRREGVAGDLLVTVDVVIPKDLPEAARKALEEYAQAAPRAPREHIDRQVRLG
jgi:molecular chaperone DnaJ